MPIVPDAAQVEARALYVIGSSADLGEVGLVRSGVSECRIAFVSRRC
jgi:hypothetical protein